MRAGESRCVCVSKLRVMLVIVASKFARRFLEQRQVRLIGFLRLVA